ncbi:unnamed protein product, partial [Cyprideis torosa]
MPVPGVLSVYSLTELDPFSLQFGHPSATTGKAMALYIEEGVSLALKGHVSALVTGPISKFALRQAGYSYPGHTEMLAKLTKTEHVTMMMVGKTLRVSLITIHNSLAQVPALLTTEKIYNHILLVHRSLREDFALAAPRIGIAGLNPHAGEGQLFGEEEQRLLQPAVDLARAQGITISDPLPPDTIFNKAANNAFDSVIALYHDQGLIPFKLLHFDDGVNVTLGLPIIRTSVDHGTAYDIA